MKCTVKFNAVIHFTSGWHGFGLEKARVRYRKVQVSMDEVYGHEQRHILDRLEKLNAQVIMPLKNEKSEFSTPGNCGSKKSEYLTIYQDLMKTYSKPGVTVVHDNDPTTTLPDDREPIAPLPGSTTAPPGVPFPTASNTD